jgi:predicted PurR-regulated permease PerM
MPDSTWKNIGVTRALSFVVLVTIIVVIGILFYRVMASFLLPLFLAALLVVIFRPLHFWFLARCGGRSRVAAGLTTATVLLIVLAPIGLVITLAVNEGIQIASDPDVRTVQQRMSKLRQRLGLESPYIEPLQRIGAGLEALEQQMPVSAELQAASAAKLLERVDHLERQVLAAPPTEGPSHAVGIDDDFARRSSALVGPLRDALQQLATSLPGSLDSERAVDDAGAALRRLRQHLLGGAFRAWLIDLANPTEEELREVRSGLFAHFQGGLVTAGAATGAAAVKLIIGLVVMVLALYFFLADGPAMLQSLMRLSPLDDQYEHELLDEFIKISRAVVVATLLSAVVQGVLAGIGYSFAGVGAVFLLMCITTVFSLIPFFGSWSVWVPVCLYQLLYEERPLAAGLLALYCATVVGLSDNVVKAMVLHGQSRLHPLLAFLSVIGGVAALGPIGILVGPMVVVFLQTLLNIMQRELASLDERASSSEAIPAVTTTTEVALDAGAPAATETGE